MIDKFVLKRLISLLEKELDEFIKENSSDVEYDEDEVLDITSGVTDCDGCNANSVWGFVRGMERAKDIIRREKV